MTDIATAIHNDISKDISHGGQTCIGQARYSIYVYDKFVDGKMGANKWIMLQSDNDKVRILKEAKKLYDTQRYQKIEIKEKSFDSKKQRNKIQTVQVFGKTHNHNKMRFITGFLIVISAAALVIVSIL